MGVSLPHISPEIRLLICVSGIYFFYLFYGVLQERMFKPDENGESLDNTLFLLGCQCFVNLVVAAIGMFGIGAKPFSKSIHDKARQSPLLRLIPHNGTVWLAFISLTYMLAMFTSNQALKYVNYPTQVLGKSCKMIPVMLANVIIGGKRYSTKEYLFVLAITMGIVFFNFGKSSKAGGGENSWWGLGLLFSSLIGDGLTSSNQRLFRDEYSPSTHALMFHMNMWSCVYLAALMMFTGDGMRGIMYLSTHPLMVLDLLSFSVCSAMGQNFIFYTITGPGPLACTTITTTRKFFTILVSVLLYPENSLSPLQWAGVTFVFSGLVGELSDKFFKQRAKRNKGGNMQKAV